MKDFTENNSNEVDDKLIKYDAQYLEYN